MEILFYVFIVICSFIAGMGIGGGSIFLLVSSIINICDFKQAQIYNLIMFIAVGISSSIYSIKNKKIDFEIFKKLIFFIIIGSIIGVFLNKIVDIKISQKIFLIFMALMGIYEIISSLKQFFYAKNKSDERSWTLWIL